MTRNRLKGDPGFSPQLCHIGVRATCCTSCHTPLPICGRMSADGAGPLIHLNEIGRLSLLQLFTPLYIPDTVWSETVDQERLADTAVLRRFVGHWGQSLPARHHHTCRCRACHQTALRRQFTVCHPSDCGFGDRAITPSRLPR